MIILLDIVIVEMLLQRIVKLCFAVAFLQAMQNLSSNIGIDRRLHKAQHSVQINRHSVRLHRGVNRPADRLHLNHGCFFPQTDSGRLALLFLFRLISLQEELTTSGTDR